MRKHEKIDNYKRIGVPKKGYKYSYCIFLRISALTKYAKQ